MEKDDQRNFVLALVLCFGLFFFYNMFVLEPQQRAAKQAQERAQAQVVATTPSLNVQLRTRNEIVQEDTSARLRVPVDAAAVDGTVLLKGSKIDDVSLKGYYETVTAKREKDKSAEVRLLSPEGTERAFYALVNWTPKQGSTTPATSLPDENSIWTQTSTGPLSETSPLTLTWSSGSVRIDRRIEIDSDYLFTVTDTLTNTGAAPIDVQATAVMRQRQLKELVQPPPGARAGAVGTYGTKKAQYRSYSDLSKSDTDKSKAVAESVDAGWIGLTTKYWMAALVPQQNEPVQMLASVANANGQSMFMAGFTLSPYTVAPAQAITKVTHLFAGAKRVAALDRYENVNGFPAFTDAVDWGWLFFITKPFFWMLQTFSGWFGAFGFAILALTVVVKTVFFPLLYMSGKSMAKLRKLQPEMKSLQDRFAADPQRMRVEQAKLWQREKVNPITGCLPMIPQMFVFMALYSVLIATLEMRHTPFPFSWIQDMSAPDPLSVFNLFGLIQVNGAPWNPSSIPFIGGLMMVGPWAILYGLTMMALQSLSAPPTDPMQRAIIRWIPLIFTVMFGGLASGLVIYYVFSNTITLIQQYLILRMTGVDTELDKFLKKRFGKKPPPDAGDTSARAPAE